MGTLGKILIMETQGNTGMNIYTRQIMELLDIEAQEALKVQHIIDCEIEIDLSECTERQFRKCVRTAYNILLDDTVEFPG
jgi:hypothetical protein